MKRYSFKNFIFVLVKIRRIRTATRVLPVRAIQRSLSSMARKYSNELSTYQFHSGDPELRRQMKNGKKGDVAIIF